MESASPERSGVLVVRAWIEEDAERGLRARITSTLDIARGDEVVSLAARPEEIYEAVREWLEAFVRGGGV